MNEQKILPVVLSGGSGTRLWPLSRALYPKQLLPLAGPATMLQETVQRVSDRARFLPPVIVCNDAHRFIIAEQLREIGVKDAAIVIEPMGRNTAPAATVAALIATESDADRPLLVMPSDHVIADKAAFDSACALALKAAVDEGKLVTFGVKPARPETGYGYIEQGEALAKIPGCHRVKRFVEKPTLEKATEYVGSGRYVWNSGIFLFTAGSLLEEIEAHRPDILEACRDAHAKMRSDLDFRRLDEAAFAACPADSIDYAVMEKTQRAAVTPVSMGWSDVGSWSSLWQISERDGQGNAVHGDVIAIDSEGCYLRSEGPAVAAVGLTDIVLVATKDAVLAVSRDAAQDVKAVVDRLALDKREEHISHVTVYRPWGSYQTIDNEERFQVKRIVVKPGEKLSLQMHHHRAEHWIVVKGTARVTRGEETLTVFENESTYIPMGVKHRLENPGKIPLHLIEVQSGTYLGEDDIVRFDDTYGRS